MSPPAPELRTPRLLLRRWRSEDREPFARLNADPVAMAHFPGPLTRRESDDLADRIEAGLAADDFGLWAVEAPGTAPFLGFVGLSVPGFEAHFQPAVEIGWRLLPAYWGSGYAPEAAAACLDHAFGTLALPEVVSLTTIANRRSRRVMEKLGMTHDPADDFDHPSLPVGSPLRAHVLYRLAREAWVGAIRPGR